MKQFFRPFVWLIACLAFSTAHAIQTESIVHEGFTKFDKGDFEHVGITHDGKIFPSQQLREVAALPASIVWEAIRSDTGELIVSTGNNGSVYQVAPSGEYKVVFQPEEALSRALELDDEGRIYVGTSPRGRVYRIHPDGTQEVFFDPKDLYIWDMQVGPDGYLYVATGGKGRIYRIPLDYSMGDEPEVIFEASETHINQLAFTTDGTAMIIGCGSGGNLYRVDFEGNYYGLYHSGADEIKAIFPREDGSIAFSTFSADSDNGKNTNSDSNSSNGGNDSSTFLFTVRAGALPEENGLLHLDADGNMRVIWSLAPNKLFSCHELADGSWMIGSGTNGRVFHAQNISDWSNTMAVPSGGEVTQLLPGSADSKPWILISSNPARIYELRAEASEGSTYTSDVIDTGKMVDWGALRYLSVNGSFSNGVAIETRSGNIEDPNRSWSDWQALDENRIQSPNSRFIQYRVTFEPLSHGIQRVQLFYQEQNLAPTLDQIKLFPGAYRLFTTPNQTKNVNFANIFGNSNQLSEIQRIPQLVKEKEEGAMTAAWLPGDPNRDRLLFDLEVKRVGEEGWLKIADSLEEPVFAMDIRGLEEGFYQLKVTADDSLDNYPDQALQFSRMSDPFLIDFTSPSVSVTNEFSDSGTYTIEVEVNDRFGVIQNAYYVVDGQQLKKALPEDGMFDSNAETFSLEFSGLEPGDHSFIFQGYDENGNIGLVTRRFHVE
jgi:sugar lactone lactonase YvrE